MTYTVELFCDVHLGHRILVSRLYDLDDFAYPVGGRVVHKTDDWSLTAVLYTVGGRVVHKTDDGSLIAVLYTVGGPVVHKTDDWSLIAVLSLD